MIIKTVIVTILIVSILAYTYRSFVPNLVPVISNFDGKEYMVQNYPDKQSAADGIAKMCSRLNKFIDILVKEYPDDERVQRLKSNFKCSKIKEGTGSFGQTSYTVNKGEEMVLCMRDRNKSLHRENLLTFVTLHEIAHTGNLTYGHDKSFEKFFVFLLEEAEARNFYQHERFNMNSVNYCGLKIDSLPH